MSSFSRSGNGATLPGPAWVQIGLSSKGSLDPRQAFAWSTLAGKVVCALPGGTPVLPLAYRAALIDCLGNPCRATAWAGSVVVSESRLSAPLGTSDSTRFVQPYLGAAAAMLIAFAPGPGLFHVGSVSASHENPPPYEPPVGTTFCGSMT